MANNVNANPLKRAHVDVATPSQNQAKALRVDIQRPVTLQVPSLMDFFKIDDFSIVDSRIDRLDLFAKNKQIIENSSFLPISLKNVSSVYKIELLYKYVCLKNIGSRIELQNSTPEQIEESYDLLYLIKKNQVPFYLIGFDFDKILSHKGYISYLLFWPDRAENHPNSKEKILEFCTKFQILNNFSPIEFPERHPPKEVISQIDFYYNMTLAFTKKLSMKFEIVTALTDFKQLGQEREFLYVNRNIFLRQLEKSSDLNVVKKEVKKELLKLYGLEFEDPAIDGDVAADQYKVILDRACFLLSCDHKGFETCIARLSPSECNALMKLSYELANQDPKLAFTTHFKWMGVDQATIVETKALLRKLNVPVFAIHQLKSFEDKLFILSHLEEIAQNPMIHENGHLAFFRQYIEEKKVVQSPILGSLGRPVVVINKLVCSQESDQGQKLIHDAELPKVKNSPDLIFDTYKVHQFGEAAFARFNISKGLIVRSLNVNLLFKDQPSGFMLKGDLTLDSLEELALFIPSENPNLIPAAYQDISGHQKVALVASRAIKPGEVFSINTGEKSLDPKIVGLKVSFQVSLEETDKFNKHEYGVLQKNGTLAPLSEDPWLTNLLKQKAHAKGIHPLSAGYVKNVEKMDFAIKPENISYGKSSTGIGLFVNEGKAYKKGTLLGCYIGALRFTDDDRCDYAYEIADKVEISPQESRQLYERGHIQSALKRKISLESTSSVYGNWTRFINHSSSPNIEARVLTYKGIPYVFFFAKEFIKSGEQLLISYEEAYWEKRNIQPLPIYPRSHLEEL